MKTRSKGIVLSYIYLIVNMLCGLFLSSYLIKSLGDTEYGIYQTISSFANYLVLLEFGTGTVMTRNISMCRGINESKKKINENVSTIWTITNILAIVILVASICMFFSLEKIYANSLNAENIVAAKRIFVIVTLHLIISFYAQSFTGLTLAFEKYSYGPILKISKTILRTGLLACLLLKFKYSVIIAIVDAFISLLTLIVSYIYCKKNFDLSFSFKCFNFAIFKNVLPLSIALFLQSLISQANNSVDKFLIGILISPEAVTLYSIALFIFNIFASICTVPVNMYAPQIGKDIGGGATPGSLREKYVSAAKLTAIIGGSIFFGFIAVGKPFITLLYGNDYYDAWIIAILLMLPNLLSMFIGVLTNVLDVLGKRLVFTAALAATTLSNTILTIFWLKAWGPIGAASATCLCTLAQLIFMIYYYSKKIKINVIHIYATCFKSIIPSQIVATAAGYATSSIIPCTTKLFSFLSLLAGGCVYVVIFGGIFLIFNKKDRDIILKTMKAFIKK